MTGVIFDASALIAMIKEEPGGDLVTRAMAKARISAVNLAEVISHFDYLGTPHAEIDAMIDPLPFDVVPADRELAKLAGTLRAVTAGQGLSLGDRFCLALAMREGLPAWTADRAWSVVAERVGVEVVLIR